MQEIHDLTSNQAKAIACLAAGVTIERAAQQTGVNPSTLHRWLKDDSFQQAYRQARRQAVEQSLVQLQAAANDAARTLVEIMNDAEMSASTRLRAAQVVIDASLKWAEIDDLQERIAALEVALAGQQGDGAYPFH